MPSPATADMNSSHGLDRHDSPRRDGTAARRTPTSRPRCRSETNRLDLNRKPTPLSGMAMEMILRRMKIDGVTVHGFRSSFRDWCGEVSTFPREVAEAALAHVAGDQTERAYRRGDALEKRRALMEAWATYCEPKAGNVVSIARLPR